MMGKYCGGHKVAWALVIIGALNWGLIGAFKYDLVMSLLGRWPMVPRIIYILVGLAGLMMLFCMKCKSCKVDSK